MTKGLYKGRSSHHYEGARTLLQAATFLFPSVTAPNILPGIPKRPRDFSVVAKAVLWGTFGAGVSELARLEPAPKKPWLRLSRDHLQGTLVKRGLKKRS